MKILTILAGLSAAAALSVTLAAPTASLASQQGRDTLLGGVAGAGAGAVLTHGSPGGALVGAAGGALIGNAVGHGHRSYHRGYNRGYHDDHHGYDHR